MKFSSTKHANAVRLIASADLHLGRVLPLPKILKNYLTTPEGTWEALVDWTLDEEVAADALLLAGDIFDREENVLEAPYFFEKGLRRLSEAGKKVILIAGNHDWRAIKRRQRLLDLPGIYMLGLEGCWEAVEIPFKTQTICFEGWSFPSSECNQNPLMTLPPPPKNKVAIGLLHGDCNGAKDSPYAPFPLRGLMESGRQCWVLGHVHIPRLLHPDPPIFYCGSLLGLDSNERGRHGAWIIDVDVDGKVQTTMCPIASLVWHEIVINVTGIDPNDYEKELQATVEKATTEWGNVRMVSLQVIWRGEVKEGAKAKDALKKIEGIYFTLNKQRRFIDCHVHTSIIEIRPAVDLQLRSQEKTILGLIAKQLLELEGKAQSVQRMRRFIDQMASSYPHFSFSTDEETLAEELRKKGYEILLEILDQRKEG